MVVKCKCAHQATSRIVSAFGERPTERSELVGRKRPSRLARLAFSAHVLVVWHSWRSWRSWHSWHSWRSWRSTRPWRSCPGQPRRRALHSSRLGELFGDSLRSILSAIVACSNDGPTSSSSRSEFDLFAGLGQPNPPSPVMGSPFHCERCTDGERTRQMNRRCGSVRTARAREGLAAHRVPR
jgi:hypothetical protein